MEAHVKFAVTMDDGSLAIVSFATQTRSPTLPPGAVWLDQENRVWFREPTDANVWAELTKMFPGVNQAGIKRAKAVSFVRITDEMLPKGRTYRNAWQLRDGKIVEDLALAKDVHRDKLRNERTERLPPLDIAWSRAMATGDKAGAKKVEGERQRLRDVTDDPRIDAATTIEELRQVQLPP